MNITTRERQLYEELWQGFPAYGDFAPGERYLPAFLDMITAAANSRPWENCRVLDAGCGTGKGALALAQEGFPVTCLDITPDGLVPEARHFPFRQSPLWAPLTQVAGKFEFEFVYCTDVLEHIPQQFTMLVVQRLLEVARGGVFLSISLVPDLFGTFIGTPLHQTVQPYSWWMQNLGTLAEVLEARDLGVVGLYLLKGQGR